MENVASKVRLNPKFIGLLLGPILCCIILLLHPFPLSPEANRVLAAMLWMVTWWVTECVPIPITALLPMLLFPAFDVQTLDATARAYSNPIVYLFFGGFMLALGLEEHGLHKRIALMIIRFTGFSPSRLILGFMVSTALLSMWISNTATAIMMLPMAMSVLQLITKSQGQKLNPFFATSLILSIAYAANIGGIATLIGTPPNLVMAAQLKQEVGIEVSFLSWLLVALPTSVVLLFVTFFMLVTVLYPCRKFSIEGVEEIFAREQAALGKIGFAERNMLIVFLITASLWVFRGTIDSVFPQLRLTDTTIALLAAVSLFLVPARMTDYRPLLHWDATKKLPWGILLLFGGGLALAGALSETGVIAALGNGFAALSAGQFWLAVILLTAVALFLTEVMSNVALISVFVPVLCGIATAMEIHPLYLAVPATMASSCAFMLPMATPPNAIVFSSGFLQVRQMATAGFWLNLMSITVIIIMTQTLLHLCFDLTVAK